MQNKQKKFAKIIATLGPSTSSLKEIDALINAGADAFRLNFSHGTHETQRKRKNELLELLQTFKVLNFVLVNSLVEK